MQHCHSFPQTSIAILGCDPDLSVGCVAVSILWLTPGCGSADGPHAAAMNTVQKPYPSSRAGFLQLGCSTMDTVIPDVILSILEQHMSILYIIHMSAYIYHTYVYTHTHTLI